jgi:flagellum-specific peptidoglycan hydrolase FlgJ
MQSHLESERLTSAAQGAVACEKTTGVPAELTVAQWAVESGWGAHEPGNNCFGIKAYSGCYGVQLLETSEVVEGVAKSFHLEFAMFPTLAACFQKHAQLISEAAPYRQVWQQYKASKSVTALVEGIAPIYATAPNYARTLLNVISMPQVASAIANARLAGA